MDIGILFWLIDFYEEMFVISSFFCYTFLGGICMVRIGIPLKYSPLEDGRCILYLGEKVRQCFQKASISKGCQPWRRIFSWKESRLCSVRISNGFWSRWRNATSAPCTLPWWSCSGISGCTIKSDHKKMNIHNTIYDQTLSWGVLAKLLLFIYSFVQAYVPIRRTGRTHSS